MIVRRPIFRRLLAASVVAIASAPSAVQACAVCFGAPEKVGNAMNAAIFVMLGCIGSMLALVGGVAFHISRRPPGPPPANPV